MRLIILMTLFLSGCGPILSDDIQDNGQPAPLFLTNNPLCWLMCNSHLTVTGGDLAQDGATASGTKQITSTSSSTRTKQ